MNKICLAIIWIILAPLCLAAVTHPDQTPCKSYGPGGDEHGPRGWHMDSVGDLENDPPYYPIYWIYKWLFPITDADCRIKEFFKGQDLCFGQDLPGQQGPVTRVRLAAVGDMMVKKHLNPQTARHLFDDVRDQLYLPDISFGNLESPVDPSRKIGSFPAYNATPDQVRLYKDAGFDVFSTANNHVLDQKESGLIATLEFLDQEKISHVGSSRSIEERDEKFPVLEAKGIRIAFLAYTFSTNGRKLSSGHEFMVNLIPFNIIGEQPDISLIQKHIRTARDRGAHLVIVSLHWNMEYEFFPPERIIVLGHKIADSGADIILGHHPHVLQPLEKYVPSRSEAGPAVPEVLIAYSLGNIIPDAYQLECQTSIILNVEFSRALVHGCEKFWISRVSWTPVWWYGRAIPGSRDYRIINIEKALSHESDPSAYPFLKKRQLRKLHQAQNILHDLFEPR